MQSVQVTIRDIPHSIALEDHVHKKAQKLDHFYQHIQMCRVVIDQTQKHKHQGKLFSVRIDLAVPGKNLVVNRKKNEDIYVAIRDAFDAIERQLESYSRRQRGHVKCHQEINKGIVARTFPDEGYGFIRGIDGTEYYFSASNVSHPDFDHIHVGDSVEFLTKIADEGLQANRITRERNNHFVADAA